MKKNFHLFEVKYLGATNTLGARFVVKSLRFESKKIYCVNYKDNTVLETACFELEKLSINIIGTASIGNGIDYIITDTFKNPFENK